jgi:hypothetical protein
MEIQQQGIMGVSMWMLLIVGAVALVVVAGVVVVIANANSDKGQG